MPEVQSPFESAKFDKASVAVNLKLMPEENERETCPHCGSENLERGVGEGLTKPKPYLECKDCGALLAWG